MQRALPDRPVTLSRYNSVIIHWINEIPTVLFSFANQWIGRQKKLSPYFSWWSFYQAREQASWFIQFFTHIPYLVL